MSAWLDGASWLLCCTVAILWCAAVMVYIAINNSLALVLKLLIIWYGQYIVCNRLSVETCTAVELYARDVNSYHKHYDRNK